LDLRRDMINAARALARQGDAAQLASKVAGASPPDRDALMAEVEGLLVPLSPKEEEELNALDPLGYPATRAFIPAFKKLDAQAAFNSAFSAFIAGIAMRAKV
jgi:histidine ammonia-lyase